MEFNLNYLSEKLKIDYEYLFGKFNKDPIDKDELLNFLNRKKRFANNADLEEFKSLIINDIKPMMNIFEFIKNNDYNIELGSWFKDIWHPLFEQKDVLITDDILFFIHYGVSEGGFAPSENIKQIRKHLLDSIKNYNLEYKEIKYDDPIVSKYEYIQNDIKKISPNNLAKKTWIIVSIENFKKLIASIRTKVAKDLKEYMRKLEKLSEDYGKYSKDYDLMIKYKINPDPMNVFDFVKNNNYKFELGSWFRDIWYPLFEQKDVLITNEILWFIHYGISAHCEPWAEKLSIIKYNLIYSLKQYELEYKEIKYDDPIVSKYEYIQNDIKKISPNNLAKKTWILLTVRNFKKLILSLRTKVASDIRDYYITLEEILYDYAKYINDYNIKIKDIKEQEKIKEIEYIKNKELSELENIKNKELQLKNEELIKANKKSVRIDKFINNVVIKSDKLEWIYIASTDQYQQDKLYKIGSTERLHKRITGYQTGRPDAYYYVWVKHCYNSKDLDYHIQSVLKDFKYKPNKELYHGIHIDDLINIVEFIMDNHDKTLEYFYDFVKNKLENSLIKDPKIMNPLDIKSISYTIGNYTETINIEEENNNLIRMELFNFLETIEDKTIIKRIDLINKLKINMNKIDIWNNLKETLKWKNGKELLKYNDKEFYLKY